MSADLLGILEGYQGSAVLAAAVRNGIADVLAGGPRTAAEAAAVCGTDVRATRALLGALAALGLVEPVLQQPDGRQTSFGLTGVGAPLARSHPDSIAAIVEKEWFFYGAWAGLDAAIGDGHARIDPWPERLRRDPQQSLGFLRALDDLAGRFGGELPALAGPLAGAHGDGAARRLLDVGGGAGSHAARLVAANPGLTATVLDLAPVEQVQRERNRSLAFLVGDLELARFGRPAGEMWDFVLLANILHDHPPQQCATIVERASELLRPGGELLVYEWILDEGRASPASVAMFALMMLVENEGGAAYTLEELSPWLTAAGLHDVRMRRGDGPIAVLRAHKPADRGAAGDG